MTYQAFDGTKPTTAQTRQAAITSILENGLALRDATVLMAFKGWNYSASGGTAAQPQYVYLKSGSEWLRSTLTWGTTGGADGNVTVAVHEYSANGGSSYSTIGTETMTYDSDGNITATTWS